MADLELIAKNSSCGVCPKKARAFVAHAALGSEEMVSRIEPVLPRVVISKNVFGPNYGIRLKRTFRAYVAFVLERLPHKLIQFCHAL